MLACCSCSMPKYILESFENAITHFSSSSIMLILQCQCRCFRRPLIVMVAKSVVILMIWYIITTQIQANRCYYHPCTLFRRWITPYEASCCVGLRNKRNMAPWITQAILSSRQRDIRKAFGSRAFWSFLWNTCWNQCATLIGRLTPHGHDGASLEKSGRHVGFREISLHLIRFVSDWS